MTNCNKLDYEYIYIKYTKIVMELILHTCFRWMFFPPPKIFLTLREA